MYNKTHLPTFNSFLFLMNTNYNIISMSESNKSNTIIHNEKQIYYNQVRGVLCEKNDEEQFCNITIEAGHETKRYINFCLKKSLFDKIFNTIEIGEKVFIRFFASSKFKNEKWYTVLNVLECSKI